MMSQHTILTQADVNSENDTLQRDIEAIRKDMAALAAANPLEAALCEVADSPLEVPTSALCCVPLISAACRRRGVQAAIACVVTCGKYCANIMNNPLDPKFQTIKLENKAFAVPLLTPTAL